MTVAADEIAKTSGPKDRKFKVFVSYSRANMSFAEELVAGLTYDGRYEVTIDLDSILEGEEWKLRLGALIADADTVVFILSPASVQSDMCHWEVEEAHRLSKRILPVLAEPVGTLPVQNRLAALNYVRFDMLDNGRPRSFMAGLNALVRALNTDVAWLREHTRYLTLAMSWDDAGRTANRLLSGSDIPAAKAWEKRRPKAAPQPTEMQLHFIRASEEAEAERASLERRRLAEIDAAQKAREEALAKAERETKRADRFITLVSLNPAGQRAMEKIGLEAIEVTSALVTTSDTSEHERLRDRFWELYYGPMYIIEMYQARYSPSGHSVIETSMVRFGERLKDAEGKPLPHESLRSCAKVVRDECIAYLKLPALERCKKSVS